MIHISIAPETIFSVGPFNVTNSLLTTYMVMVLLIAGVVIFSRYINVVRPSRVQILLESILGAFRSLCEQIAGKKNGRQFFPIVLTFFLFILSLNWFGLLPGIGSIGLEKKHVNEASGATEKSVDQGVGLVDDNEALTAESAGEVKSESEFLPLFRAGTADLNTTLAFALISVVLAQIYGIYHLGLMKHLQKYFNFKDPLMFFVGILELVSEFAKILSFSFRLFGNVFAGEVLLVVIAFLMPVIAPLPFYGLEVFVGFIQALVFGMLTLIFLSTATEHHE